MSVPPRDREPEFREDYLWNRSGEPDPGIEALERALGRYRHRGGPVPEPLPVERHGLPAWRWSAAAALAAAVLLAVAIFFGGASAPEVRLQVDGGSVLGVSQWVNPTEKTVLELDRYGQLTLAPGSRLRVDRLDLEQTSLYLELGELDAFVNLNAKPRFFQVGTPAVRCVDLGCAYTLTVDPEGVAEVRVTLGQVAFENRDGREVLVLRDAMCRARPDRGAGTPRYVDSPEALHEALDRFDAADAPEDRRRLARAALEAAGDAGLADDALPSWHLMGDPDAQVATWAVAHVAERYGRPEGLETAEGAAPSPADLEVWKDYLGLGW